jgi:hypothetical protein
VLITSVGFTYQNFTKKQLPYISQTRGRYQKVVHDNELLYISPVNGINIRLLSMEVNDPTSLYCLIYTFQKVVHNKKLPIALPA